MITFVNLDLKLDTKQIFQKSLNPPIFSMSLIA